MRSRSAFLFTLFVLVSFAGFVAGWLFQDGASVRGFAALGLTLGVSLVAGALATRPERGR